MKEKANIKTKIAVVGIILLTLLIIGIISVPNVLQKMGVQVGEKEGEDAEDVQVLVGKTFTSSLAGVGAAGAMADYTQNLQTAQIAANETGVSIVNIPAGYYEQIQVDARAVYQAGLNAGVTKHTQTYQAKTRSNSINLGETHYYRYIDTTGVPNTNSGTYTYAANSTGGTVDMGETNTYRYVNASNVYNKGKADGKGSLSFLGKVTNSSDSPSDISATTNCDCKLLIVIGYCVNDASNNGNNSLSGSGLNDIGSWQRSEEDGWCSVRLAYAKNISKNTTYTYSGRYDVNIILLQFG